MFKSLFVLLSIVIQHTLGNYFVHITDAHIDLEYKVGSPANCLIGDKLGTHCCREYKLHNSNKLTMSELCDLLI